MAVEISPSDQVRAARGSALKKARKAAGLSAERLAQFVNDRTVGSDLTRHAIYSYEQGKVLLSREVGHRIATALQLHPGHLLLGDPEYAPPAPGSSPGISPGSSTETSNNTGTGVDDASSAGTPAHAEPGVGVAVKLRVELVEWAERTLAPAEVLARLLREERRGRIDINGYLDVFHLLLDDLQPFKDSAVWSAVETYGDHRGNEAPFALGRFMLALHDTADALLKRLLASDQDNPNSLFDFCVEETEKLTALTKSIRGEIDACNKRLPGVSEELD